MWHGFLKIQHYRAYYHRKPSLGTVCNNNKNILKISVLGTNIIIMFLSKPYLTPWWLSVCRANRPVGLDIWTGTSEWWYSLGGGHGPLFQHAAQGQLQCSHLLIALCLCGGMMPSFICITFIVFNCIPLPCLGLGFISETKTLERAMQKA